MVYMFSFCLFFILSYLLYRVIWGLPVWCQSWAITSTWGISCTGLYCVIIYPESLPYVQFMGLCFIAAFPFMLWLEFKQRWAKVHYWESQGLPKELQGKPIFWSHKADNLLEWIGYKLDEWAVARIERRIEQERQEAVEAAERVVNGNK